MDAYKELLKGCLHTTTAKNPYNLRNSANIYRRNIDMKKVQGSIVHHSSMLFNKLPDSIKNLSSFSCFSAATKDFFVSHSFYSVQEFLSS